MQNILYESREILALLAEIQAEANSIADKTRPESPHDKGPPILDLARLTQQLQAEAEIAGYCTTEKSRKDRRQALVRAGGVALLALFQMDREERCGACAEVRFTGVTIHQHECRPPMQVEMTSFGPPLREVSDRSDTSDHARDCGCRACSGSF